MSEAVKWSGLHDDVSDVAHGKNDSLGSASRGMSFYVQGELRRRPGLTFLAAHGGIALGTFSSPVAGSWLILFKTNGELKSVAL